MRKVNVITVFTLSALLLAMMTMPAMAATYEINKLHNWGVTIDNSTIKTIGVTSYSTLDNSQWIPTSPTAEYVVEDNMDSYWSGEPLQYTGFHTYSQNAAWIEPKMTAFNFLKYIPPSGAEYTAPSREENDIEAFYFDSDSTNAYFALVVSKPLDNMGDLALDLNGDGTYEYGIVLLNHDLLTQGEVYSDTTWEDPGAFPSSGPYIVSSGTKIGTTANVDIRDSRVKDYGRKNYVIEVCVPRDALGNPSFSNLRATMDCGNDVVELANVQWEIPEFTTIAVPACMILGLFYFFRRKRQTE